MRLIDKDALMAQLKAIRIRSNDLTIDYKRGHSDGIITAVEYADDAPTADAVPVVRGYSYEDDKTYSGPGTSNYICSVCGEMQGTWKKGLAQNQKFKFCPWCGAKMEGKP